jgi:hypothetical protein
LSKVVIPLQAGIQILGSRLKNWIPVFTGMTSITISDFFEAGMSPWMKFLVRAVLSLGLAVILSRLFFYPFSYPGFVVLAIFLLGMGTLSERFRRRR